MKISVLITVLNLIFISFIMNSCSDGNSLSSKINTVNKGILENYSSFEVEVSASPITIPQIINGSWSSKPNSNYGLTPSIIFEINDNNTIDVLWLEPNSTKHLSRISLDSKSLIEDININENVNSTGNILGFEKMGYDEFIIGYTRDNSYGDENNEAWYTAFNKNEEIFSTRIFGDESNDEVGSKGAPSSAGSAVIRYSSESNILNVYLAHTQKYNDEIRHQGGWVGFLNCANGDIVMNNSSHVGSGWFYSHNFDQRSILTSDGYFYLLAHGDAYPRALGVSRIGYQNGFETKLEYYKLKNGSIGDNFTNSHTGDLVELSNDNIGIVYSTGEGRDQRDLRVSIVGGMKTNTPEVINNTWITENLTHFVGWGSKISQYGEYILVAWNLFDENNKGVNSNFKLLSLSGNLISDTETLDEICLYPAQSILATSDGKKLVWISAHGDNKLKIHTLNIS